MKLTLVILTLNEIEGLQSIFHQIPQSQVDEVIAVDGGSIDGTLEFFSKNGIKVYKQMHRGRGEAFRVAFEKAKGDALVFFSPDGNENPKDIACFREYFEAGHSIVIANRMSHGGRNEEDDQIFKFRKWANNAFTLIANLAWNRGRYVHDTINGFRGITKKAWHAIRLDGEGYTIEYQSSIRAFKLGLKVKEFPTIESTRIGGNEGSPSLSTGIAFFKLFWKELRVRKSFTQSSHI